MLPEIDRLFLTAIATMLVLMLMTGCEVLIRRPPVETRRLAAEALLMESQSEVLRECRHMMQLQQAGPCPIAVTIAITRKYGEVAEFQMMPPIPFLATFSAVLGETQ